MTGISRRTVLAAASLASVVGLAAAARLSGQAPGLPSTKNGEWPYYTADVQGFALLAARSDQRQQLQPARSRVAVQDRQPRHAPRVQARRHAADGQGRHLRHRRHAPLGRRARREDRRDDLGARREAKARAPWHAPRQLSGRGLSYWTDGKGDDRVIYVTTGYRLVALNAKTGVPRQPASATTASST